MYKKNKINRSKMVVNEGYHGETIETKIRRLMTVGEPLEAEVEPIYMERNEGVKAAYDIRTDRFEIAAEAMDKKYQADIAKREQKYKDRDAAKKKTMGEEATEGMQKENRSEGKA